LRDEIRHAIAVLRLVERAVRADASSERIAEIVRGLRHAAEINNSALLTGVAEALEDWLIGRETGENDEGQAR
jgi:hypothetical protein